MKRCPVCRRNYTDETLRFCLDDGAQLVDGPAEPASKVSPAGDSGPVTAILNSPQTGDEALTKRQVSHPGQAPISAADSRQERSGKGSGSTGKFWTFGGLALLLVASLFFGYRYFAPVRTQQINSIAVLPLVNESGNPDVEYLSDGMTESLIGSLSQIRNLSVKARSSVFRYKGKEIDAQLIGKELAVQAILMGRIVQRADDLTLYLELVDASTGNRIWSDQYIRKTSDVISLQNEITRDVSRKLETKLSGADEQRLKKNYTENVEAYQVYLRGRFHVFKLTPPEVQKSIGYFQRAIEIDPSYALAYAGLSDAYRSLALTGDMDPNETLPKSKAAANKAIEIDDDLAEGHTALGVSLFWYDWNWAGAEVQYKRAIELNPNSALAHLFYAHLLSNIGRHAESISEVKRARELDPLSAFVGALEGQFLVHAGRTDEALDRLRQASELDPTFYFPHQFAASAYIEKGMYAEATTEGRRARELGPNQTVSDAFIGYALAKWGKRDEAQAILAQLLKQSSEKFVPPYHIAFVYQGLGDTDQALNWLEKGYAVRDPKMAFLKVEPKWNNLRADPRFQELMRKMAFP